MKPDDIDLCIAADAAWLEGARTAEQYLFAGCDNLGGLIVSADALWGLLRENTAKLQALAAERRAQLRAGRRERTALSEKGKV